MPTARLSKLEFQIMHVLWSGKEASIREVQESIAADATAGRAPAYTTIQTTVYRMEAKGLVKRTRKLGNFHMFAAVLSRGAAQRRILDDLLSVFGGTGHTVMAHLVRTGRLTLDDVKEAETMLQTLGKGDQKS